MLMSLKKEFYSFCFLLFIFSISSYAEVANGDPAPSSSLETLRDGQIRQNENKHLEAWDNVANQWLSIELFWDQYGERRGGLTWGSRTEYPPYSKVKELDTMLINLPAGACMMEFFHGRWRRANDVRRWSKEFDDYGGCPNVFD